MGKPSIAGSVLVALIVALSAVPSAAENGPARYSPPPPPRPQALGGGISIAGAVVPIGSSQAGDDDSFASQWFIAPNYDDAFDTGLALRAEAFVDFTPMVRGQFGVVHNKWDGKSYDDGFGPVRFGDLKMTAGYFGLKFRFMPYSWIRPYAVADIGVAHLSAVDVAGLHGAGTQTPYWESTNTIYGDIGGGAEFQVGPNVGFFVDVRIQGTGKPKSADAPTSDAEGLASVPVTVGVNLSFGPGYR